MSRPRKWDIRFDVQVDALPADTKTLCRVVEAVMRRFRERQAVINVVIVGDAQMKKLNRRFLNTNATTDVLSFDLTDEFEKRRIFELVVNAEMACRQARRRGHLPEAELALYIVHGVLHNLGFNDDSPERARLMHQTEDAVLSNLGLGSLYVDSEFEY